MRYLVNGKEMKAIDMRSIHEYGIPSLVLMERAALEVANEAEHLAISGNGCSNVKNSRDSKGTIWAVCGLGNNGADGVAAVRVMHLRGYWGLIVVRVGGRWRGEEVGGGV